MTFYARILAHCLWLATLEPRYARKAAAWYEATTDGLLDGLLADFDRQTKPT